MSHWEAAKHDWCFHTVYSYSCLSSMLGSQLKFIYFLLHPHSCTLYLVNGPLSYRLMSSECNTTVPKGHWPRTATITVWYCYVNVLVGTWLVYSIQKNPWAVASQSAAQWRNPLNYPSLSPESTRITYYHGSGGSWIEKKKSQIHPLLYCNQVLAFIWCLVGCFERRCTHSRQWLRQ